MKPSQPEDVGAGSNVPVQPDALGKTQQQDQLNPFAATSASSSPDAGLPRTKPRTNWAAASLVLGITSIVTSWFCVGFVFAIPGVVCGVVGIRQAKRASYKGIPRRDIPMAIAGVIMGGIGLVLSIVGITVIVMALNAK